MKKQISFILLTVLWLLPAWLPAQTNAPDRAVSNRRFLFILETSRSMQRRSEASLSVVQGLLQSGFQSQARDGDSLGFWTFNTELYTGRLPLQRWSTADQRNISNHTLEFVRGQKYEKTANVDLVLAAANHLIESSELITIVLVVSGDAEIHGTAFDDAINSSYRLWRNQQQQARSPFVTVLRGVKGKLTQASTTPALWPVELPPLPPEPPPVAAVVAVKKPEPVATPPMAAPLILSGRKSAATESTRPTEPVPAATASTPAATPVAPTPTPATETTTAKPALVVPAATPPAATTASPPLTKVEPAPVAVAPTRETDPARSTLTEPPPAKPAAIADAPVSVVNSPSSPSTAPASAAVSNPATAAAPPAPAAPLAIAAPPSPSGKSWLGWLGLLFVVAVLVVIALMRAQRARRTHVSLITQSLDRERTK